MSLCDRCGKIGQTTSVVDDMLTKSQVSRAIENADFGCGCCDSPNKLKNLLLEELGLK